MDYTEKITEQIDLNWESMFMVFDDMANPYDVHEGKRYGIEKC